MQMLQRLGKVYGVEFELTLEMFSFPFLPKRCFVWCCELLCCSTTPSACHLGRYLRSLCFLHLTFTLLVHVYEMMDTNELRI